MRINPRVVFSAVVVLVVAWVVVLFVGARLRPSTDDAPLTQAPAQPSPSRATASELTQALQARALIYIELYASPPSTKRTELLRAFVVNDRAYAALDIAGEETTLAASGAHGITVTVDRSSPISFKTASTSDDLTTVDVSLWLNTERKGVRINHIPARYLTRWTHTGDDWKLVTIQSE